MTTSRLGFMEDAKKNPVYKSLTGDSFVKIEVQGRWEDTLRQPSAKPKITLTRDKIKF